MQYIQTVMALYVINLV